MILAARSKVFVLSFVPLSRLIGGRVAAFRQYATIVRIQRPLAPVVVSVRRNAALLVPLNGSGRWQHLVSYPLGRSVGADNNILSSDNVRRRRLESARSGRKICALLAFCINNPVNIFPCGSALLESDNPAIGSKHNVSSPVFQKL